MQDVEALERTLCEGSAGDNETFNFQSFFYSIYFLLLLLIYTCMIRNSKRMEADQDAVRCAFLEFVDRTKRDMFKACLFGIIWLALVGKKKSGDTGRMLRLNTETEEEKKEREKQEQKGGRNVKQNPKWIQHAVFCSNRLEKVAFLSEFVKDYQNTHLEDCAEVAKVLEGHLWEQGLKKRSTSSIKLLFGMLQRSKAGQCSSGS